MFSNKFYSQKIPLSFLFPNFSPSSIPQVVLMSDPQFSAWFELITWNITLDFSVRSSWSEDLLILKDQCFRTLRNHSLKVFYLLEAVSTQLQESSIKVHHYLMNLGDLEDSVDSCTWIAWSDVWPSFPLINWSSHICSPSAPSASWKCWGLL